MIYGKETGVLPLRQSVKETVNLPYNLELSRIFNKGILNLDITLEKLEFIYIYRIP